MSSLQNLKNKLLDKLHLTGYWRRRKKYALGEHTYINHTTTIGYSTKIGKYCSIAANTCIGMGNHLLDCLTTHPFIYTNNIKQYGDIICDSSKLVKLTEKGVTQIGNDVWIGYGAIVTSGVKIGDGAVIAAGAVVTKDVEPYSIVGGVPAKHIRYRFDKETIDGLLETKWWDLDENFIKELPFQDVKLCIKKIRDYRKNKEYEN